MLLQVFWIHETDQVRNWFANPKSAIIFQVYFIWRAKIGSQLPKRKWLERYRVSILDFHIFGGTESKFAIIFQIEFIRINF